jgi:hypothetical protein
MSRHPAIVSNHSTLPLLIMAKSGQVAATSALAPVALTATLH